MLKPTLPGKMVVGPALTVRNIRRRADPRVAAQQNKNGMAEFEAHNLAEDGDVLVISGVSGVSNMGGIRPTPPSARAAGRVVDEVVQTIDVMPTLLAISGLAAPMEVQGQSLVPLIRRAGRRRGHRGGRVQPSRRRRSPIRPKERRLGRTTPSRSRLSRAAGS